MDYKISIKDLKKADSVAIKVYYNMPVYDGVYDRFTLKHYCTISRGVVNKRYLSYVKIMENPNSLRSLKYILCDRPSLSFRMIYRPDKKLTMNLLKRRKRNTGLKMEVW